MKKNRSSYISDVPNPDVLSSSIGREPRRKGRLKNLLKGMALVAVSLVLTFLFAELVLRGLYRDSMDFDMQFWKYASEIKVRTNNPRLIFNHRPDQRAFLMGVNVATNSFGLRGPEATLSKPANVYRVVVIGDSFTLGWGVAQDQTYVARLEQMLNAKPPEGFPQAARYEVLNLGVGAYNTVQEVERLRQLGLRFNPDMVLLGYFINDAETAHSEVMDNFLIRRSYLYAFAASRLRRLMMGFAGEPAYKYYYRSLYSGHKAGWRDAQAALADLAQIGKKKQISTVVYILPELHDLSAAYPFLEINKRVIALGDRIGLRVVDLLPAFTGYSPEKNLWVSPTDAHPNALAHSMIAQEIYNSLSAEPVSMLRNQGVIPTSQSSSPHLRSHLKPDRYLALQDYVANNSGCDSVSICYVNPGRSDAI